MLEKTVVLLVCAFALCVASSLSIAKGGKSHGGSHSSGGSHSVKGHTTKKGTYVAPHRATNPMAGSRCFWTLRETVGTSSVVSPARSILIRRRPIWSCPSRGSAYR